MKGFWRTDMKVSAGILAGSAALCLLAGAGIADAQTVRARVASQTSAQPAQDAFSVSQTGQSSQPNQINPQTRRSTLRWDAVRGRWGLQVDMDQNGQRDLQWRDVQAGAFYSVTRSLRVGGAVSLGDGALPARTAPTPQAPRVRLETAFRF